jgi:hypothetical protein
MGFSSCQSDVAGERAALEVPEDIDETPTGNAVA